jgi:trafficking protein particle complex subunit 10
MKLMQEAIAFTFELVGLFEDALFHYDELEASYYQTMSEQGYTWFKKFGGDKVQDGSKDVLDFAQKSYRELIVQNDITIFDFRLYLFSRQCQLLIISSLPNEMLRRAKFFILAFYSTLKEYKVMHDNCRNHFQLYLKKTGPSQLACR